MSKMGPPPDYYPTGDYHEHPHHRYAPQPHHQQYAPQPHPHPHQNQGVHNTFAPVHNQPQSQATNIVINNGQNAALERDWSTQLCGCFEDVGGCMCAICCTTCMAMSVTTKMNEFFCLPFCVPQWLLTLRVKIRAQNKIKGGIMKDCIITSCCPACALCQLKREMDNIDRKKPLGTL